MGQFKASLVIQLKTTSFSFTYLLQEPVQDTNDIIKFCEETELPVALDETIDECHKDPLKLLAEYSHPGIVAAVSNQVSLAYTFFFYFSWSEL